MEAEAAEVMFQILVGAVAVGLLSGVLILVIRIGQKGLEKGLELGEKGINKAKEITKEVQDKVKSDKQRILEIDDKIFLIAQKEIDNNNQIESLWIKARVLSGGDEDIRELEYIKLRADELKKETKSK